MSMLHKISIAVALAVAGCAGPSTAQISNPATDPASPQATAAPAAPGYQFVQAPASVSPNISPSQGAAEDGAGLQHSAHDMPGMPHGAHGMPPAAPQAGKSVQPVANKPTATQYTCTMHPEVRAEKPGKCPKCGMKLVPVEKRPDEGRP